MKEFETLFQESIFNLREGVRVKVNSLDIISLIRGIEVLLEP